MDTFLDEIGETKKLNAVDKNNCESEITLEDYEHAISTLCDNKFPGNHGLTAEFYKTFSLQSQHIPAATPAQKESREIHTPYPLPQSLRNITT